MPRRPEPSDFYQSASPPPTTPNVAPFPFDLPPYDYQAFWRTTSTDHTPPADTKNPAHLRQVAALDRALKVHSVLPPQVSSIFEAGCGFGRLAAYFAREFPEATYHGIDLNINAIKSTWDLRPDAVLEVGDLITYDVADRYEDPEFNGYDLVIASEVLMHVPPEHLEAAFDNLVSLTNPDGGRLVTIDWVPLDGELVRLKRRTRANRTSGFPSGIAPWNFPHNYDRLFRSRTSILGSHRTDRQMIFVMKP